MTLFNNNVGWFYLTIMYWCFCLDLECLPKVECATIEWHYWEMVGPLRHGAFSEIFRSLRWAFRGDTSSFLFLFLTFWPWGKWICPKRDSSHDVLPQAQINRPTWSRTETSKTMSQNETFLFLRWLSWVLGEKKAD
jgi:hypothetical protein